MDWHVHQHCLEFDYYPHQSIDIDTINWKDYPGAWMARWTSDFDCTEETKFWYIIKDSPLKIENLKSKRRYEINKGKKNFYTAVISPMEYVDDLYDVYCKSLTGYHNPHNPMTYTAFKELCTRWSCITEQVLFGTFSREDNSLCAYADVYRRDPYIPISSLKSKPDMERGGVNFALVAGILEYFKKELEEGNYLCDGSRVLVHETHFQDYLEKYFQFRKAYCHLNIQYKKPLNIFVKVLYPLRKIIKTSKNSTLNNLSKLLIMEEWSREK